MADETTDKSTREHLAVSARYVNYGFLAVSLITDIEIPNGTAETNFGAIFNDCGGFPKMSGFHSAGATVILGKIWCCNQDN